MTMRNCWCGNKNFAPFGPEYGECRACGTLVFRGGPPSEDLQVRDDETDFYGKKYWLEHQQEAFGYDDIHTRARTDLTERNLHWLWALLKYCLPPARVMELGCAHGSFVALLRQAGYDASGVEMSPWVVEYGQKTFGVPIAVGPVEKLDLHSGRHDAIVLMDVLEHLPDPVATMSHCLQLLKPNGLLLIQTPQYKEDMSYAALLETGGSFLEQLKAGEHLYLFSSRAINTLFRQLGADHIQFETAIFDHYDMFVAVSRSAFRTHEPESIESKLSSTSSGRLVLAMLDLDANAKRHKKEADYVGLHRDRALSQVQTLTGWLKEERAEAAKLREHQARFEQARAEAESYRTQLSSARQQIETLTVWVEEARTESARMKMQLSSVGPYIDFLSSRPAQFLLKTIRIMIRPFVKLTGDAKR